MTSTPLPRRAGLRRARRTNAGLLRGFTMLELVVTIVVTGALFGLLLPWVMNLVTVSAANLDTAAAARAVTTVTAALDRDLTAAVTCPATGTPVAQSSPADLSVYTRDPGDTAAVLLVTWRLAGGNLERAAVPATLDVTTCGASDPDTDPRTHPDAVTWDTFATRVTQGAVTRSDSIAAFTDQAPPGADVVTVDLLIASADATSSTAAVSRTYELFTAYRALS